MYILNGIVYGGEPAEPIKILSVKPLNDMIMLLTFVNGEVRVFDATVLKGGVFEQLKEESIFKNPTVDHGVVTWLNGNIDCAPEFMYENSYAYGTMAV